MSPGDAEMLTQDFIKNLCIQVDHELPPNFWSTEWMSAEESKRDTIERMINKQVPFASSLITLCEELAKEPIRVPTGQKRMVKRIQPSIHYLSKESERITHQQPSEKEMTDRMVRELINLPLYTARVKTTTAAGIEEHAIRTLEPEK